MATKKTPVSSKKSGRTAARASGRTAARASGRTAARAPGSTAARAPASKTAARPSGGKAAGDAAAGTPAADDALATVRSRLDALPADRLLRPNTDVAAVATVVAGVAKKLAAGELRARFLRLPKEEFDPRHLDDLVLLGRAALTAHQRRAGATAKKNQIQVPYVVVEKSSALRRRMLRLVTYYFEDHTEHGPEIIAIRQGTGHLDLANDLDRLADLCAAEVKVLCVDTRDYRPTDVHDAQTCAQQIRDALGEHDEDTATDTWQRAFTLLVQTYNEVATTGRWLLRNDPKTAAALFPSIGGIRRSLRKPRTKSTATPKPKPESK